MLSSIQPRISAEGLVHADRLLETPFTPVPVTADEASVICTSDRRISLFSFELSVDANTDIPA
mgnify:CR=1 FL=1